MKDEDSEPVQGIHRKKKVYYKKNSKFDWSIFLVSFAEATSAEEKPAENAKAPSEKAPAPSPPTAKVDTATSSTTASKPSITYRLQYTKDWLDKFENVDISHFRPWIVSPIPEEECPKEQQSTATGSTPDEVSKADTNAADTESIPAATTTTMDIPTTVVTQADVTDRNDDESVDENKDANTDVPTEGDKDKPTDADKKTEEKPKKAELQPTTSSAQPIFKPLISEKGKSKSSGRTIGGWL